MGEVKDKIVSLEDLQIAYDAHNSRLVVLEQDGSGIAVSGATVGQTVRIAAVDENGKPTAWEAADFPESMNDLDALEALAECGIITPAYQDGVFYTDADGAIYVL